MTPETIAEIGEAALAVVGAASALAALVRPLIPKLRALALRTSITADDGAVETLAVALEYAARGVTYAYRVLAMIGLTPRRRDV